MITYWDCLVICPLGYDVFLIEADKIRPRITYTDEEDNIQIIPELNMVKLIDNGTDPCLLMFRGESKYINPIANRNWHGNAEFLTSHPAQKVLLQTGVDPEGNPVFRKQNMYEKLKEEYPALYADYIALYPEYDYVRTKDGEIVYDDIEGVPTPRPHSRQGEIRRFCDYF